MSQYAMSAKPQALACFALLCVLHGAFFLVTGIFTKAGEIPAKNEALMLTFELEPPPPQEDLVPAFETKTLPRGTPIEPASEPVVLAEIPEAAAEPAQEFLPEILDSAAVFPIETAAVDATAETAAEQIPARATGVTGVTQPGNAASAMRENDYIALIMRRLEEKKVYPLAMRRRGIEGDIPVRFTIGSGGVLVRVTVEDSQVHPFLVQAALETVRSASPFPVMADMGEDFSLHVTIRYELK